MRRPFSVSSARSGLRRSASPSTGSETNCPGIRALAVPQIRHGWMSGDFTFAVLADFGTVGIAITIVAMLLTRAVNKTGELLMSLYQFVVNRYVIPVIEAHKAEGRVEAGAWPKLGPSGTRGTGAASPPSVKDGSSSSRRRKVSAAKSARADSGKPWNRRRLSRRARRTPRLDRSLRAVLRRRQRLMPAKSFSPCLPTSAPSPLPLHPLPRLLT